MRIGITINSNSYTPEAYAYKEFLEKRGHSVELAFQKNFIENNDLNILFMGLDSCFHKKEKAKAHIIIHEYHSLSTGFFPYLKNKIKRLINKKPNARIFLNQVIKKEMGFTDNVPTILRDMGIDKAFFEVTPKEKRYDILYCGSIDGRKGLIQAIVSLAEKGFSFLIIGSYSENSKKILSKYKNITLLGKVSRKDLPPLYSLCEYALNYTPDIYPFNIQTSTKVLEYCAANLKIISNNYYWVAKFSHQRNARFFWLEPESTFNKIEQFDYITPDVYDLEWNHLLESIAFEEFILNLCKK